MRQVRVLVVGAGPAGLAAAVELRRRGITDVLLLEREDEAGGVPRHCAHTGFGMRDLHRMLSGPEYARRLVQLAGNAQVELLTRTGATGWAGDRAFDVTSPAGRDTINADAVILATGCRERPRSARLVPGDRPAGVLTTGELQQRVHGDRVFTGRRAVVVGAEHVSYSAVVTLASAGVEIVAMTTELPRHQTYWAFDRAARLRWRFPLLTRTALTRIAGHDRVASVDLTDLTNSRARAIRCDTVVFTGDWIADYELARLAGAELDPASRAPRVDTSLATGVPGVFAVGNLVHPAETADVAALTGAAVASAVTRWLDGRREPAPAAVPLAVEEPLAWIAPGLLVPTGAQPPGGRFVLRCCAIRGRGLLTVRQAERTLAVHRVRSLVPNLPVYLPADWQRAVSPDAGPVTISYTGASPELLAAGEPIPAT